MTLYKYSKNPAFEGLLFVAGNPTEPQQVLEMTDGMLSEVFSAPSSLEEWVCRNEELLRWSCAHVHDFL